MKKVFSTYKYLEERKIERLFFPKIIEQSLNTWVPMCEGKTLKECSSYGFKISDNWLVNEDEYRLYKR